MSVSSASPITPPLPDGLPDSLSGPSAWYGPDLQASGGWTVTLGPQDLAEIEAATQPWLADGTEPAQISAAGFALPTLGPRLAGPGGLLDELLQGRGFALLRGLPVAAWGPRKSALAFFGLGAHLGAARSQNAQGHLLGHVRDLGLSSDDPRVRIYQTAERQTFHTDSADLVGLLCLQTARSGGLSALVSSVTLFNELRRRRPDLAPWLFQPVATDRRGEVPPGCQPWFEIPVFNWFAGRLSALYQRQYIDSAARFAGQAPMLAAPHREALDLLDALTDDPQLHLMMALQPGDMQFVHNHSLLHDRTAFTDWPEPARRRHLLRLWLAPASARPLPPVYAQRYGSVQPGARGGVMLTDTRPHVPLP